MPLYRSIWFFLQLFKKMVVENNAVRAKKAVSITKFNIENINQLNGLAIGNSSNYFNQSHCSHLARERKNGRGETCSTDAVEDRCECKSPLRIPKFKIQNSINLKA